MAWIHFMVTIFNSGLLGPVWKARSRFPRVTSLDIPVVIQFPFNFTRLISTCWFILRCFSVIPWQANLVVTLVLLWQSCSRKPTKSLSSSLGHVITTSRWERCQPACESRMYLLVPPVGWSHNRKWRLLSQDHSPTQVEIKSNFLRPFYPVEE